MSNVLNDQIKYVPDEVTVDTDPLIKTGNIKIVNLPTYTENKLSVLYDGDSVSTSVNPLKCVNITNGETVAAYITARDA